MSIAMHSGSERVNVMDIDLFQTESVILAFNVLL